MKTVFYILLAGSVLFLIIATTTKADWKRDQLYDGCYEQFVSYSVPAEAFQSFMSDCMAINN